MMKSTPDIRHTTIIETQEVPVKATISRIFVPVAMVLFLSLGISNHSSAISWFDASWQFRKQLTIAGTTAGAQTNYQMKLIVHKGTGTDSGADVYLGTHCLDNFNDIRFTKSDGTTLLNFWIESFTSGTSAIFWIMFDAIPASPGTANFYIYYGNSGAISASNGTNTFDWFDDFSDGSISGSYTKTGLTTGWTEANGVLTFTTSGTTANDPNVLIINNKTYNYGYEIRGKVRVRQWLDSDNSRTGFGLISDATGKGYKGLFHYATAKTRAVLHDGVAWLSESNYAWSLNTWYNMAFFAKIVSSTRTLYEKDWVTGAAEPAGYNITTTSTNTTNQGTQPTIAGASIPAGGLGTQFIGDYDDVFVRKCAVTEPTWGTWGAEQNVPPAITGFSPGSGCKGAAGIVITGTNFTGTTAVNFNGVSASFVVDNSTQITATVPLTATSGSISVTTPAGTATSSSSFIVNPLPTASATKTDISCFNAGDGQIIVTGANGTAPYTYSIYNGVAHSPYPDYQSGNTFNGLAPGQYQIRVKDNNQCESIQIP